MKVETYQASCNLKRSIRSGGIHLDFVCGSIFDSQHSPQLINFLLRWDLTLLKNQAGMAQSPEVILELDDLGALALLQLQRSIQIMKVWQSCRIHTGATCSHNTERMSKQNLVLIGSKLGRVGRHGQIAICRLHICSLKQARQNYLWAFHVPCTLRCLISYRHGIGWTAKGQA